MREFSGDSDEGFGEVEFDDWNDGMDSELRKHRVNPAAYTRCERLAAWADGMDTAEAAEGFARCYYANLAGYDDVVAPGDRDDPVDYAYDDVRSMSQQDSDYSI